MSTNFSIIPRYYGEFNENCLISSRVITFIQTDEASMCVILLLVVVIAPKKMSILRK